MMKIQGPQAPMELHQKASSSKEPVVRSSSKALKVNDLSDDESEEEVEEDDLALISHKIHKMWRNKSGSKWKNSSRRMPQDKKDRGKRQDIPSLNVQIWRKSR